MLKAEFASPVGAQEGPVFHVRLWTPPSDSRVSWMVDDWDLTDCDVLQALEWAADHSGGNPYELFVRTGSPDFYRLYGRPGDDGGAQVTVILTSDPSNEGEYQDEK